MILSRRIRFSLSLFLLAAFGGAGAAQAQSPTPVTSIVNSNQDTTLQVGYNGSLLMQGTFINDGTENDSIPAEGAGTRLIWYPAKAAFRAGRIGRRLGKDDVWDADSTGDYSVALGLDTKATAYATMAIGDGTEATDLRATAMGSQTTASGQVATAMGSNTTADGIASTTMGSQTAANGNQSTAMGFDTEANSRQATAMGNQTLADGFAATAMGSLTGAFTLGSLSVGTCNSANRSADNTLFVVGNGTRGANSCDSFSDAFTVDESGSAKASSHDTFSDRRLKTGVEPLSKGVLKALRDIDPVRYQFKDQSTHPSGEQVGLIAQDVRKKFPSLVSKGAGGYLSLAYPKMTAVLLKGIQEQQAELETKKQEIANLKAENEEIKERLAALERQHSSALPAGLAGPLGLAVLFGLGGLGIGLLWRRRA
jgi:hypothetical protein